MSEYHRDDNLWGFFYFVCLLEYFKKKDILWHKFKMKDFIDGNQYNCCGGYRPFKDIDLSPGQIRYAISYGLKQGLIHEISRTYRKFYQPHLKWEGYLL